ncbi:MAG: hypothetical protein HXY34_13965 [Candidatus Thorarchaeota archaeon]|nr:hypothetical protein [Candidatus Thorarchaeota archaeon]
MPTSHALEAQDGMMNLDQGSYMLLSSATGAFSCRYSTIPRTWNHIDRPHVALLLLRNGGVVYVLLSEPTRDDHASRPWLAVADLDRLPNGSVIEVRYSSTRFSYYRKDDRVWTKVAESISPFFIDIFSGGTAPVSIEAFEMYSDAEVSMT